VLSNGGTYPPYIAISWSVKYKLTKRVHSVKLYCKFVKHFGMTMLSERNSTHRTGHNLSCDCTGVPFVFQYHHSPN